jgi:hypothetical protein
MWFQILYHRDLHRYSDFDVGDFELLAIGESIQICVASYSSPCHHCALVIIFTKILSRNSNLNLDQCLNEGFVVSIYEFVGLFQNVAPEMLPSNFKFVYLF